MKKISLFLTLIFFSVKIFAGSVEFSFHFDQPTIKNVGDFQLFQFENTLQTGITGEPALPYASVNLLLPPGEEAVSVTYEYEEEILVPGHFSIYPRQPSRPVSVGSDDVFYQDQDLYASSDTYPVKAWGEYSTHFMNGHSFLLASFTPVKYIPSSGSVSYYKKITITVTTRPTERAAQALKNLSTTSQVNERIRSLAQNPGMVDSYPPERSRDNGYQVLIITPQSFQDSYQDLTDVYLEHGLTTEIATTEDIDNNITGSDLQEKIRNFIIQEYQQNGIQYVLLGGDDEWVPHRGFYCYVVSGGGYEDSDIPADLYYSALDGNWNTDGDGYWGEVGEDDLLPDVAVARFPASTISQLQKLILKSQRYQDQPVLGELRKPIMAGENLWSDPLTYGEDYLELLIGEHSDNGYTTNGIPEDYNFQKLYDHLETWDGSELIQAINQGTSFVHHSGHANQTYVMRLDISQINNANFSSANGIDHNYTLVYSHGCLCGAFDENDCIGEAMVCIDNFAAAVVMNSRYGWFNEGQTEGPSAHLHREFVNALYNERESHIGTAHMISKIATSSWVNAPGQWEEGALRWCFYCCNVLGDPVLGIWTDEPIEIETTYPEEIIPGTTMVPVTVMSDNQPLEGAMCTIISGGNMLGCAMTDSVGQAEITIPGGFEGLTEAELVVTGYNCLPHHYPLSLVVGIQEMESGIISLSCKPNPFSQEVTLYFNMNTTENVAIDCYMANAAKLCSYVVDGKTGMNEFKPDVSNWPDGVLIIKMSTATGIKTYRMIHLKK